MKTINLSERAKFYLNMYSAIYLSCNDFNYDNCQSAIDNNDSWEECVSKALDECGGDNSHPDFETRVMSFYEPIVEKLAMEIWDYYRKQVPSQLSLFDVLKLMSNNDYRLYE